MLEFKRKKRVEERAKESGAVKGKSCEDILGLSCVKMY